MICSSKCVKPRIGSSLQHCGVCHRTFGSTTIGDAHRVPLKVEEDSSGRLRRVDHRNRCPTEQEMLALGWSINPKTRAWRGPRGCPSYWE